MMTNTCINYQTIMPPVFGDHVAFGDTGVVIYSNSVCGARSNFERAVRSGRWSDGPNPALWSASGCPSSSQQTLSCRAQPAGPDGMGGLGRNNWPDGGQLLGSACH